MKKIQVGIVMGSDSDYPAMKECALMLEKFGIKYSITVASAHRSPAWVRRHIKETEKNGAGVIIAAAGGAAHLPGVIAANTVLPVIGVPMETKALSGMDSLFSIVQMPSGVPVASMAIGGAMNAAIFAAQILALKQPGLKKQLQQHKKEMEKKVTTKAGKFNQRDPL